MNTMLNSKKGVSPLVATILLIAFAIALGAVVMSYGSAYYSNKQVGAAVTSPIEQCAMITLSVYAINDKQQVCYGGEGANGYVNFMLDNQGNVDINQLTVTIIGEKGSKEHILTPLISKGQIFDKRDRTLAYSFDDNGKIFQIQIRPYIKVDDTLQVCIDKQIVIDNIKKC